MKKKRIISEVNGNPKRTLKSEGRVRGHRAFKALEDTRDLSFLGAIAADGTRKAYLKAVEVSDTMVELRNGEVIRRRKDGAVEILTKLEPRKEVQKGKTITLP